VSVRVEANVILLSSLYRVFEILSRDHSAIKSLISVASTCDKTDSIQCVFYGLNLFLNIIFIIIIYIILYLLKNTVCNTWISQFTVHYIYIYHIRVHNLYTDKAYYNLGGPMCNARLSSSQCCRVHAPRHLWYTADAASDDSKNHNILYYI